MAYDIVIRVIGEDRASGPLGNVSRSLGGLSDVVKIAAGGLLSGAISGGISLVGDLTHKVLDAGIGFNALKEQAEIAFTTMLGDGEKATAFIQDLASFAAKTPFEFPDLLMAGKNLVAVGIETSRVIPIMTTLGDATSAMGTGAEGIRRATLALQQMGTLGRVTGQDMLQLTQAGIPAWDALAASMGKPIAEVQKMVSDGLVPAEQMFKALETRAGTTLGRIGGMMAQQSKSFDGLISTLKDNFTQAAGKVLEPFFDGMKGGLSDLVSFTSGEGFQQGLENIANFLRGGLAAVMPILREGGGFLVNTLIPALSQLASGNWMAAIWQIFGPEQGFGVIKLLLPLVDAFQARIGMFGNFFAQLMPIAGAFGAWLQTNLLPAFLQFGNFLATNVLPPLMQFGAWLDGVILGAIVGLAQWIASALLPAFSQMAATIGPVLMPVLAQMGGWIQGTLIPAFQQLAAFVGPILQTAFAWLGGFIVGTLLPALTTLIVWILTKGLPGLGDLAAIIGGVLNGALATLGNLWKGIVENFNKAVTFIADTTANMQALANAITSSIGAAFQWLNDTILQPLAQTFSWLVGLAESFMEWLQKIADALANMQIPDFLQRHSPSPLEQALLYSNQHLKEMAGLLPGSLGALGGLRAPGALGFGYANGGLGTRGALTDARRTVNINGNVSIGNADAAREFWRLMNEWENRIAADARLIG